MEFPSQYIDDCHVGQLLATPARSVIVPRAQRAEAAAYIVCYSPWANRDFGTNSKDKGWLLRIDST